MSDKIRVLFLAADPFDERTRLRLDEEARAVDAAIQRGSGRDALELTPHLAVRIADLQHVLQRRRPQVVHFAGHGDGAGGIVLGDEYGRQREVARDALDALFRALEHPPRVLVLNACNTLAPGAAAGGGSGELSAVEAGGAVDFTVSMNNRIGDGWAIVFAEAFYGALAAGETVTRAFEQGVVRLRLEGSPDVKMPVLHVRPGADPQTVLVDRSHPEDTSRPEVDSPGAAQILVLGRVKTKRFKAESLQDPTAGGSGRRPGQSVSIPELDSDDVTLRTEDIRRSEPR